MSGGTDDTGSGPPHAPASSGQSDLAHGTGDTARRSLLPLLLEVSVWTGLLALLLFWGEAEFAYRKSTLLFVAAVFLCALCFTGRPRAAAAVTAMLAGLIATISAAKTYYLGVPFVFADLLYLTGEALWTTLAQYTALSVAGGIGCVVLAVVTAWIATRPARSITPLFRVCCFVAAGAMTWQLQDAAKPILWWDPDATRTGGLVSPFANSVTGVVHNMYGTIRFQDVGAAGLDPVPTVGRGVGAHDTRPDVFMILQESVFDPEILGLPVEPDVQQHFYPVDGVSGRLNVTVHGGGTWVSEFAVSTGIDPRAFGDKSYYLPVVMEGRVRHSLISHLNALGYETIVVYCMQEGFMNAGGHYRGLGVDLFDGSTQDHVTGIVWSEPDHVFYDRALDHIERIRETSDKPVFVLIATISNHGPHGEGIGVVEGHETARAWVEKTLPESHHAAYREYYMLLQDNIADYEQLKNTYRERFPERSALVVKFGDHQPQFTKDHAARAGLGDKDIIYKTGFSMEGVNRKVAAVPDWGEGALDIPYLPALLLAAAGLERDPLFDARLDLMEKCRGLYQACADPLKGRIHRSLVDQGFLDVDETVPQVLRNAGLSAD
ncbi:MAG: sulfatase-like hydrolase/transferase [Pseudomonadota bacterium]